MKIGTKLTMAMAIGALSGAVIFNALKPHKKTVDDYVNCFNREIEMYKLQDNEKELANNPAWDFHVIFDLQRISEKETEEFMRKSGYIFERELNGSDSGSVRYRVEIPTYEKAEKLSEGLFECLRDSRRALLIKTTDFNYSNLKTLE